MDTKEEFSQITELIKNGDIDTANMRTYSLADAHKGDPSISIRCASIMKVIGDDDGTVKILRDMLADLPEDEPERFEALFAAGILGMPEEARTGMESMPLIRERPQQYGRILFMSGRYEDALKAVSGSESKDSRILRAEALCALGRYGEAVSESAALAEEDGSYEAAVSYCRSLISANRGKEAVKFAKSKLKSDKRSVDSLAVMAYVMRLEGKLLAAVNYGNRTLKTDPLHIGGLETMAMCLVEKGDVAHAKLFAGTINHKSPGHPAAVRIPDACKSIS